MAFSQRGWCNAARLRSVICADQVVGVGKIRESHIARGASLWPVRSGGGKPDGSWPPGSLLGGLPGSVRDRLLGIGAKQQFADPGRKLIREGDSSGGVYLLLTGVVKVSAAIDAGEALLAIRVGGDVVGELSALDGRPRSATVTTASPVLAQVTSQGEFAAFLAREPEVALAIARGVTDKLRSATARRIDFTSCGVATRFARVLLELADRYGRQTADGVVIQCPLNQTELATIVGAAEPSIQRVLRQLRADGVVRTGYRDPTVLDMAALRRHAYPDQAHILQSLFHVEWLHGMAT